ncbi:hypothetical protein Pme01_46080 [Planosporangium mesophilum]|uniref:Uncharacterized protein n=2 Tax=Planosporangium mesophilum TaxID=689768 RepID=A0A8J3X2K1_9ACTN|nr:hypothetical protein Pme01_46080 [Planosporangium mesophilum]
MRGRSKAAKAIATWLVATSLGISLSWFGVRPVLDAAVPERLVAFPVAEPGSPLPTPAPRSPSADTRVVPPSHRAVPRSPKPSARPASPSPAPAPPVRSPFAEWTPLGDGEYVRRFQLSGGDVTVLATDASVELLSATPQPLYVMTILPTGQNHFIVSFTTILRSSRLEISLLDDAPAVTVTEFPQRR